MIEEADFKKNGLIDFEELQQLMFDDEDTTISSISAMTKVITDSLKSLDALGFKPSSVTE